ncbi:MAG: alpha/beta hydrolase [Pirellulales bacterium]|nr:alpha/beta hydrolase [Pirellulales bacterium]
MNRSLRCGLLFAALGFSLACQTVWAQPPAKKADPFDRAALLKRYDKDGNGKLERGEWRAIREDIQSGRLALPKEARERLNRLRGGNPALWDKVAVQRDVEYGKAGERSLKLDLVLPKKPSDKPRPVIVFIHGGGWQAGDKSHGVALVARFAASGDYVGASVGYRLSGEAIWPAQIHDCKAAIRWLAANSERLGIDPKRIGVWGISAGGHLVNMLGTTGDEPSLEGDCGSPDAPSRVACVVAFCGPSDLRHLGGAAGNPVEQLLGGPAREKREAAKSASPVVWASQGDPPFLLVHGTEDPLVPIAQAEKLHAALKAAGVDATLFEVEGAGHGLGGPEVEKRVSAFFAKHLLGRDVEAPPGPVAVPSP